MIRDGKHSLIGGPPQVLKIYQHMNVRPYAVYWPNRDSMRISFLGRPLLDYETTEYMALDPDTLQMEPLPSYEQRSQGRAQPPVAVV